MERIEQVVRARPDGCGVKKEGQSRVWRTMGKRPPPDDAAHAAPLRVILFEYGSGGRRHASCIAHVRRTFHDVLKSDKTNRHAAEELTLIGKLYEIEWENVHAMLEDRLEARRTKSSPVLQAFRSWLYRIGDSITPQSTRGQAVRYQQS